MQYYEDDERTGKRAGIIATVVYLAVAAVLMLVLKISLPERETGEGILIDFGDTEQAGGSMATARPIPAEQQYPRGAPSVANPEDIMTQEIEEAPEVTQPQPRPERQPSETQQAQQQLRAVPEPEIPPREVDTRALFPGSNQQAASNSQGTSEGKGRQGAQDGTPGGNPEGSGTGQGGTGFSLSGRSILGSLPQPRYGPDKSGRVIVDITVDATGKVIRAVPRGQGSTTNDSELISAAIDAAGKARFNVVEGDGLQTGTITYNFILK